MYSIDIICLFAYLWNKYFFTMVYHLQLHYLFSISTIICHPSRSVMPIVLHGTHSMRTCCVSLEMGCSISRPATFLSISRSYKASWWALVAPRSSAYMCMPWAQWMSHNLHRCTSILRKKCLGIRDYYLKMIDIFGSVLH